MGIEHLASSLANLPAFVVTWLTFSVAGVISFLIVIISNHRRLGLRGLLGHCFPFDRWRQKSARMDIKLYIAGKITDKIYAGLAPLCTLFISDLTREVFKFVFPNHLAAQPTYFIIVCCSLIIFFVSELSYYITHYLQHYVPALWEIHKVHHSAKFLNPLTARRGHPLGFVFDETISAIFVGILAGSFLMLFKFNLADVLFLYACASKLGTVITMDALKHSHFSVSFGPLEGILISPYMHQIHHSTKEEHWDKNFGINLSIWDWIFGTGFKPRNYEEIIYGLGDGEEHDYDKFWGVYAGPLLKMWRLVVGERSSGSVSEPPALDRISFGSGVLWRKSGASNSAGDERSLAAD